MTDNQVPDLDHFSGEFRTKIQIVDHTDIFAEFAEHLHVQFAGHREHDLADPRAVGAFRLFQ